MADAERSEQSCSHEISITSVHAVRGSRHVLIGRDEDEILRRALASSSILPREPAVGETWRVGGTFRVHPVYGEQIEAVTALPLVPRGHALIRLLATDRRFSGVGWATATRLWEKFGPDIYEVVLRGDVQALADVIGFERAIVIIEEFGMFRDEVEVLRDLDQYGVSARTAGAAARLWGTSALRKLQEDPFEFTLLEPWPSVDAFALRIGVPPDDRRRRVAAVAEALSERYRAGDMLAGTSDVTRRARQLLGPGSVPVGDACATAIDRGEIVEIGKDSIQLAGCHFIEREVERLILDRLGLGGHVLDDNVIRQVLTETESRMRFSLTPQQCKAVLMAASSRISVISGGAGTGKTAVLRAILDARKAIWAARSGPGEAEPPIFQMAVAGRAAKRMAIATGRDAWTISRFINSIERSGRRPVSGLVVIDEMSMVDTPTLYRILMQLHPDVDILFVGDTAQLPPIGGGRPLQALLKSKLIPWMTLDVVHRQAIETGVPAIAANIRSGTMPSLTHFDLRHGRKNGVFIHPAQRGDLLESTMTVFRALAGSPPLASNAQSLHELDIQILCQTTNGPSGTRMINQAVETEYMTHQRPIADWGIHCGSKLIWLKNDYEKGPLRKPDGTHRTDPDTGKPLYAGFMNGALGIVRVTGSGVRLSLDDGATDMIEPQDLEKLTRGWAITVHKAQGSAFRRVIIPVMKSRLLDRAMIYTAITRASETAVLVGDIDEISEVVASLPSADRRRCGLRFE
ncbi:AAA family ATPase [Agrobacterium tumefaciens]|uniref:AAA family ATPase n=1 Tax=Agrobacterium tumefaciens TaxID=358 RepID=UPI0039A62D5C